MPRLQTLNFPPLSDVGIECRRIPDDLHPDDAPSESVMMAHRDILPTRPTA